MYKLHLLILPIFILISLQFLISNIKILSKPVSGDFEYFYIAGQRALLGQNPYVKFGEGFLRNPPPTLFIYSLLPLLPIQISQVVFFIISFIAFLLGSYFLFKTASQSPGWKVWLTYLSLVLIFFPFRYTLGSGHINNLLFLFLILTLYFLKQKGGIISGFFLALSISLSITPAFLMFAFLLQRRYRMLILTIVSLFAILVVTLLRFGPNLFINYQLASSSYLDFGISAYYNQSLAALLNRVFHNPQLTSFLVFNSFIIGSLIFAYFIIKSRNGIKQNITIWSISILYLLIFVPFAWQYHFILTIFCLVITYHIALKLKVGYKFFLLIMLSYLLIGWNIKNPQAFENISTVGPFILSHVLIGALLLLFLNFYLLKRFFKT